MVYDSNGSVSLEAIFQSGNLYAYCMSNPVGLVDPSGDIAIRNCIMMAVNIFKDLTKSGRLDKLISLGIGALRDSSGVFHIRQDYWQSWTYVGYNDIYDKVFGWATNFTGTSMDRKIFQFDLGSESLRFWAWKGDYINLGAGAEMGIYTKIPGVDHWLTAPQYALPMTLSLKDTKGHEIFSWNPGESNWWITGFSDQHQGMQAIDLIMKVVIDFSGNLDMWKAFYKDNRGKKYWSFDLENYKATFQW